MLSVGKYSLARCFASRASINYYEVLNVSPNASTDDIKAAYRELVKKFHPDVAAQPSQDRFRLITEAYTVLRNKETRVKYDLLKAPKDDIVAILSKKRDKDGLDVEKPKYQPHEYGYKRLKELAEERKRYNLDKFYRFKGGLPQKDGGNIRAGSIGVVGERANPVYINTFARDGINGAAESHEVNETIALTYKISQAQDSQILTKKYPFMPAEVDYNFTKFRRIKRYFIFLAGFIGVTAFSYTHSEAPKAFNRMKIKEMLEKPNEKLPTAGMRAVGFS
jgi:curved DNA-binding protein CbpA